MIEQDVRWQIDRSLETTGWFLDVQDSRRNVFFEGSVKNRLSGQSIVRLGQKQPDYTLFDGSVPIAVIEAKKPSVMNLDEALNQAADYADRIGVDLVFACNGPTLKSQFLSNNKPLYLNDIEVNEFLPLNLLRRFKTLDTNKVYTIPKEVIRSRTQLITLFSELNGDLRADGIRAGIERFSEFANILFLKLLSEKGEHDFWSELSRMHEDHLLQYLNSVVMNDLREDYGGEVITRSEIKNASTLKKIVSTLSPLRLTDVDEDVKGVAFEHFIQKTTDTQNDLGEYFTPRHVVRFMVRLLNPQYGQNVYDPFCGTGGFLTESFKHIGQQCGFSRDAAETLYKKTVFGSEITTTARIAKMNMILFGDGHSGVEQQNSLRIDTTDQYDNILSNIPFSQYLPVEVIDAVGGGARDADEACVIKCLDSLRPGGRMAVVVPDGLLFNRSHVEFWRFIFLNSCVRLIARLPRGCFAPYTDARTAVLYLTDKGARQTDWFYRVTIRDDGFDSKRNPTTGINDLEKTLFFYRDSEIPDSNLPTDLEVSVVSVMGLESKRSYYLHENWDTDPTEEYVRLDEIAILKNGKSITEATTTEGNIPVIAGGRGTVPYTHGEWNHSGGVFTVSKSGAYSGYVWWHDDPIWASDSIVIRSKDESRFLSRYLYLCMTVKQEEIYKRQQGTGQPHIYISHIRDFPIPTISIEEQYLILEHFEEVWSRKRTIEYELTESTAVVKEHIKQYYGQQE